MMWACIILLGPVAIIVINWDWIKGLFGDSFKFQALAPALERIRDNGITYKDLYWMEAKLNKLQIPCPRVYIHGTFNPADVFDDDTYGLLSKWTEFVMALVPLVYRPETWWTGVQGHGGHSVGYSAGWRKSSSLIYW